VNNPIVNYRYSDNEFIHRLRAFKGMHFTTFMPFYLGLLPIVFMNLKRNNKFHFRIVNRTSIWIFLWVCYATFAPGTGFGHYNILLLVPICYVIGSFYSKQEADTTKLNKWATLLGVVVASFIYFNRAEAYPTIKDNTFNKTEKYIADQTPQKEPVLFLGYYQALEAIVKTGRKLPVRNATSHYICLKDSALRKYFQDGFFQDMESSRPKYVVDMEGVLDRTGLLPIKSYILDRYAPDTVIDGNRVYKNKLRTK
jgi:hypothetical protein